MRIHARSSVAILALAVLVSAVALWPTGALAVADPATDSMGIYFDAAANVNCTAAGLFQPLTAYLVLANPSAAIDGYACTVTRTGAAHTVQGDVGSGADSDASANGYVVSGFSGAITGGSLVLRTQTLMLMGSGALNFLVGPPGGPVILPNDLPLVHRDGAWVRCGVASGNVSAPVATINGACPVPEEGATFGALKALFR